MADVETRLLIDAPPQLVWERFMDKGRWKTFSDFVDLNPGQPIEQGCTFWFALRLFWLPPVPLRVEVLRCVPEREVRWVGGIPAFPLFRGEHYFRFEDAGEGRTRLVHGEDFSGPLRRAFLLLLGDAVRQAYIRFNEGLADQAWLAGRRS